MSQCHRQIIDYLTDCAAPLLVHNADTRRSDGRGPAVDQLHLQPGEAWLLTLGGRRRRRKRMEESDSRERSDNGKIELEGKKVRRTHLPPYKYGKLTVR